MALFQIGPCTALPRTQILGGTVVIAFNTWTTAGVLGTPGTSITIEIYGPDGAILVAYTAATAGVTGNYTYNFVTTTAYSPGVYGARVKTVDGGITSIQNFPALLTLTGQAA